MQNDSQKGSLSKRFESLNATPSDGLWDSISSALDEKKKRRGIIWWWTGSGIAAIAIISVLIFNNTSNLQIQSKITANPNEEFHTQLERKNSIDVTSESESAFDSNESTFVQEELNSKLNVKKNQKTSESKNDSKLTKSSGDGSIEQINTVGQLIVESENNRLAVLNEDVKKMTISEVQTLLITEDRDELLLVDLDQKRNYKWELGVGLSSWRGKAQSLTADYNESIVDTSIASLESPPLNLVNTINRPIGLSLHLGYHLNSRLSLVSGINFEFVKYNFANNSSLSFMDSEMSGFMVNWIKRYSISIPLGVEYDLIRAKKFGLGFGFSLINELPIVERISALYDLNFVGNNSDPTNLISGYHLGLQPTVNFSYNLNEKVKIQATPGMRFYPIQMTKSNVDLKDEKMWFGGLLRVVWQL